MSVLLRSELDLARHAFIAAHGRLQSDLASRDVGRWYASLGECLWWIFALDEHYSHTKGDAYRNFRDKDPHGECIPGLRLARNRVGHQIALMLEDPSAPILLPGPATPKQGIDLEQQRWRRYEDLPPADAGKERPQPTAIYKSHLSGRAARYAIRHANYFFVRRQACIDSL